MPFAPVLLADLLQAAPLPDTIVTLMVPQRDMFDWVSGAFQVVGWVLGIALLARVVMLLVSVRAAVNRLNAAMIEIGNDARPLLHASTAVIGDAREVIAMVRTDVSRLGAVAGEAGAQLLDAVETTAERVDEVNAVLDVLQDQLEHTAIGTVAALHGLRVGVSALGDGPSKRPRRGGLRSPMPHREDIDGTALVPPEYDIDVDDEAPPA